MHATCKVDKSMHRMRGVAGLVILLALGATTADAYDKLGTRKEQSARHYCWKRIGLKPDDDPTEHQAAVLKPCVKKRLGYDDPYMDQF